jgi:peptidoglycan-N-acetylmuramic acid deacetylase
MKTRVTFLICILLFALFSRSVAAESTAKSWYIKRGKDHAPPTSELSAMLGDSAFYFNNTAEEKGEKVIYLTFDVGYENGNVGKVLDVLKEEEAQGAFFLLSHVIKTEPALISRMEEEGHLLCNHTVRHKDMSGFHAEAFKKELRELEAIYSEAREGKTLSRFYRPPEGRFSAENLSTAKEMGYKTVFWSLAYADWDDKIAPSDEKAKQILMDNTHNGAIVLLHPTSDINVRILRDMLIYWKNQGYRFGSLEEL